MVVSLILFAFAASTHGYKNADYGFNIQSNQISKQMTICETPPPAPNHGVKIVSAKHACTDDVDPIVFVNAEFNTAGSRGYKELGRLYCGSSSVRRSNQTLGGMSPYECNVISNKKIKRVVFFQRLNGANIESRINYSVMGLGSKDRAAEINLLVAKIVSLIKFTDIPG